MGKHPNEPRSDDSANDVDRQFLALLEGLRTSLPGVQVLFAFLLTAPLQQRFTTLDSRERVAFAIAFYGSALASLLLIAPSVHQRMRAPLTGIRRRSHRHLMVATWLGIAGTVAMAVAVMATVYLVSEVAFDNNAAITSTAVLSATLAWSWFYLPLVRFERQDE